ncbi:PDZ domain-containing protein [Halobacillus rhizosphaerae]|uniref:PDZ domain-containing protein n=1 Tax=Halobacillus rhizosphaerae TaxID=3064889 RepID=UPI00398AA2A7
MQVWLLEILQGVGRIFTQPLFYYSFILLFILSRKRVKKERKDFGTRIFNPFTEWKGTWGLALTAGVIISGFTIMAGLELSYPFFLLLFVVTLLLSLPLRVTYLSSVYVIGVVYLLLFSISYLPASVKTNVWVADLSTIQLPGLTVLLAILLLVEAIGMLRVSTYETYPERRKGSRGKWIGQHRVRKMMIIPFFALIPGGMIEPFAPWWPLFSIGGSSFALALIPFITGWECLAKGQDPVKASKALGRRMLILALLVLACSVASLSIPLLSLLAIAISIMGRELLFILHRLQDDRHSYFSAHQEGLKVLGVIPGTPAHKMGIKPGEVVIRVNALPVKDETEFYQALQHNGAFSRLEVLDLNGENRYVQRSIYEGEHFELGILFTGESPRIREG